MSKYRIINCVVEDVVEKSHLPVKKRIIRRNARESSVYCEEDDSSAVILSEPLLRRDKEPANNIFSKEAISEYELSIDPQLDPDKYFQCDQFPLAKSKEEIQFWVTTSQPPCLYYSDNDVPKYKTRRRLVKKSPTKKYFKRETSYGVNEIVSNSSDSSESVENNHEIINNKIKKNNSISPETGDVKYQVVTSIKLKMSKEESQSKLMKSERNKSLFRKAQPYMRTNDKDTSLKIQLSKNQLNNLSMNVERGSFSRGDGKVFSAQKRNNPTLINSPENEALHRKVLCNKDELLEDFDSCSSVLTVNYIRSVNSAAKKNGKATSTRKNQYFSYNNISPQKRHLATDIHENCKILRHNQYENYVPNVQLGLNRIKCDKASPHFSKSMKKEITMPKPAVHNESEYFNESNAKRISVYRPSPNELKRNNEKVLDSCRLSTSSIENDISEHHRNQSVKTTVSQVMAVKTYSSHHNTVSYSDDNISSDNSDVPLNVVNKSIKHTTRTISYTQVEKIQYFVEN